MKKLFNSRFLFILASSLVVLILLTIGAFYLFDDEDDVFVKSGYVLNPLSSTSEKYFFNENVGYKENLSSMIEFVDVDDNTVSILKDSFIHYNDESLSFLKNGAILDLDSVSGSKAVSFYNITNESMILKKDSGYVIESANGDIRLKNFIGRISDNKYIVVGDSSLKMAGNATTVSGEYFEIVYIEEGIVNIENKNVKYQVAAEGTLISIGNKVIDLGDKKITVNNEDVMSITAITINGDENIEIIPKGNEEDEDDNGAGDGDGTGENGTTNQPGTGAGEEGNDGVGGTGNSNVQGEVKKEVVISLKSAEVGSTNIDVVFDIINAEEDDFFKLQVVNLSSGRTVDISTVQVVPDSKISVPFLTPNTRYLFMVINEKDNGKYFQKVLETTGFGIKLEKAYATDSSLAYRVVIEEGTDIANAKLTLKVFNDNSKEYDVVTVTKKDSNGNDIKIEQIRDLSDLGTSCDDIIIFDGLESDTIYTAVLDEFAVGAANFTNIYEISLTSMTLKKTPDFSELTPVKDVGASSFDLSLGKVDDPDNAIIGYTYMIYDLTDNNALAIDPIKQSNASPITVKFGDGKNELRSGTNYVYKVVIEYFDNEKYIEYVTEDSIIFKMGKEPYVTVEPDYSAVTHNSISATIYLTDSSCLIDIPGRTGCGGANTTVIVVSKINPVDGKKTMVGEPIKAEFEVGENEIKMPLTVGDLEPGTTYDISVTSSFSNGETVEIQEILHTEKSRRSITTKDLASFNIDWKPQVADEKHVLYVSAQLLAAELSGNEASIEDSINAIDKVTLKLYEGKVLNDFTTANLMRTITVKNVKERFYDNAYLISSYDTFGFSMEDLKLRSEGGKLNEYYTVVLEAYTKTNNKIKIDNEALNYYVPLYLRTEITKPELFLEPVSNSTEGKIFDRLNNNSTIVGYKLTAAFVRDSFKSAGYEPQKMNFYVYSEDKRKLEFYYKDSEDKLIKSDTITVDLGDDVEKYITTIYMDYGTAYDVVDEVLTRGNKFYIGYDIECKDNYSNGIANLPNDEETLVTSPVGYGEYKLLEPVIKDTPGIKMYVASSTSNSITYRYSISDADNAIYKNSDNYSFYATINNGKEIELNLTKVVDADYNKFDGEFTLTGLKTGDLYNIYYYRNSKKSGDVLADVGKYPIGDGSGIRTFDGYYDASKNISKYNFTYKIINNPKTDNKVTIRINANENILSRILSYKVHFEDSKGNTHDAELWKLSNCIGDPEGSVPRCLSVKYDDLKDKGMKSEDNETNLISVSVTAVYDNGLAGFDFKVGSTDKDDYKYCILQTNSSELGLGHYMSFTRADSIEIWSEELQEPKGYYTYTLNSNSIYYKSQLNLDKREHLYGSMGMDGFASSGYFVTPKMVSLDAMSSVGNNTFSFNSITPKVLVEESTKLINGSVMKFTLSGVDINDIRKETDGERYLFVEVWENKEDVGKLDASGNIDKSLLARPTVEVKIDSANPLNTIVKKIDGLKEYDVTNIKSPTGTYYFNVYAWMKIGDELVYQQLYDEEITDRYAVRTYELTSRDPATLFQSINNVKHVSSSTNYGQRDLEADIVLYSYENNVAFNFDVIYALCYVDDDNCSVDHNIFSQPGTINNATNTVKVLYDISKEKLGIDLEYSKKYKLYVFAVADHYEAPYESDRKKRNILLNRWYGEITLTDLKEPSFVVTRNALVEGNDYMIDFDITTVDPNRTLIGDYLNGGEKGKYFIKLLDETGNLVGNMQLLSDDGETYYDVPNYDTYAFDAFVTTKHVRIKGLKPNSKYSFEVYSYAFVNNYSSGTSVEDRIIKVSKIHTVYSANDYGIAFGNEITYTATENSVIVTFLGGSNFDNVVAVNYTVALWDDENSYSKSGTFVIGENEKRFEFSEYWRFIINPTDMQNPQGKALQVTISFNVKDPITNKIITLTKADIPGFTGTAEWNTGINNGG